MAERKVASGSLEVEALPLSCFQTSQTAETVLHEGALTILTRVCSDEVPASLRPTLQELDICNNPTTLFYSSCTEALLSDWLPFSDYTRLSDFVTGDSLLVVRASTIAPSFVPTS